MHKCLEKHFIQQSVICYRGHLTHYYERMRLEPETFRDPTELMLIEGYLTSLFLVHQLTFGLR